MTFARDLANFADVSANNLTFRNLIINGAMQVAQRGTSVASISSGTFIYRTADRFNTLIDSLGTWTESVENDAPTGSGFRKSLKLLCTTADASPASSDYFGLTQFIEGQNLQTILKGTSSAKPLTLSFWVKSNKTGTYIAELRDLDNTRAVSASYTISTSATWEKKTITFPADTTGVLDNDNNASFRISFYLGLGSNYTSGTLQTTWGTNVDANIGPGQTNLAAATNNYWQITGVQLEVGSSASAYEFKPIDVELAQCQRYYYKSINARYITCSNAGLNNSYASFLIHPVEMRADPTTTVFSGSNQTGTSGSATWYPGTVVAAVTLETNDKQGLGITRVGTNSYNLVIFSYTLNAEL